MFEPLQQQPWVDPSAFWCSTDGSEWRFPEQTLIHFNSRIYHHAPIFLMVRTYFLQKWLHSIWLTTLYVDQDAKSLSSFQTHSHLYRQSKTLIFNLNLVIFLLSFMFWQVYHVVLDTKSCWYFWEWRSWFCCKVCTSAVFFKNKLPFYRPKPRCRQTMSYRLVEPVRLLCEL